MRLLFLCFFLNMVLVSSQAQTKNIFELWNISEDGCLLDTISISEVEQDYAIAEEAPPPPPPGRLLTSSTDGSLKKMGDRFSYLTNKYPELSMPTIKWRDDLQFVQRNGLWGLESSKGEVVIEPSFEMVLADTTLSGFVAYNNGQCNYYDKTGKALLKSSYYHIQPAPFNTYIVRTKDGYGILDGNGDVLLPATNERIRLLARGKSTCFLIETEQYNYLYSAESKKSTYYSANEYEWRFLDERYAYISNRGILIDIKENKQLFCGQDVFVKIVNWEEKLLSVYLKSQKEVSYIIRLDGSLVSEDPWQKVGSYFDGGYVAVARPAPLKPNRRPFSVFGLIDKTGELILPLEYNRPPIEVLAGQYIRIADASNQTTLIDLTGEPLFEYRPYSSITMSDDEKTISLSWKEGNQRKQAEYDIATKMMRSIESEEYWSLRPYDCGKKTVFVAKTAKGEVLLNEDHKPLINEIPSRIFKGPEPNTFLTYRSTYSQGKREVKKQWINCKGDAHVFRLDGQKVDSCFELIKLRDNFFFVKTTATSGYFSTAKKSTLVSAYGWGEKRGTIGPDYILKTGGFSSVGWVDETGEAIALPEYESIWLDRRIGLLSVSKGQENRLYLKPDGDILFDGAYSSVRHLGMGLFLIKKEEKSGLLNQAGEVILPPEFVYLYIRKGLIYAKRTNRSKIEYYDLKGHLVD